MAIKVLHIVTRIDAGGISTFLLNNFKFMDRKEIQFDVVAIDTGVKHSYHHIFEKTGINVFYMPDSIKNRSKYLISLIKKNKYNAVHSHIELQSSFYLLIAAYCGVKIRISHAHLSRDNFGIKNKLMRKVLNKIATLRVGASDLSINAVFGEKYAKKGLVINNAVDVENYSFSQEKRELLRSELGFKPNELVLGFVGRISNQKNIFYLNKIFNQCCKSDPNIKLLVVGDGELYEEMESDLKAKGIVNSVKFLGNRNDVNDLMCAMDILLLPSLYEGLPLVLVEAQSTSLMSLVSDKITQLVNITDYIKYLGIQENNIKDWETQIKSIGNNYSRNPNIKHLITEKKFNIRTEAETLPEFIKKRWINKFVDKNFLKFKFLFNF